MNDSPFVRRKLCPRCLKKKPADEFKPRPDGSISYCYSCEVAYYKEYNVKRYASAEARDAERTRTRDRYQKIHKPARMERKRQLILTMGGKCVFCGYEKSAAALDFDHIVPATKQRTISHLLAISQPWAWDAAIEESMKCRLACSNCHREITFHGHELRPPLDFNKRIAGDVF